jgi:hypothetical protein
MVDVSAFAFVARLSTIPVSVYKRRLNVFRVLSCMPEHAWILLTDQSEVKDKDPLLQD